MIGSLKSSIERKSSREVKNGPRLRYRVKGTSKWMTKTYISSTKSKTITGVLVHTETIAATGHSFTNYVYNDNATCTEDGTKTATCNNGCGTTDTVTAAGTALGHSWDDGTITTQPTCTEEGVMTYTCIVCGATYTEEFSYVITVDQTLSRGADLTVIANGSADKFISIEINGASADASVYTVSSDYTQLTVDADYLDTLDAGEYTLTFVYDDGSVSTTFTLTDAADDT